MLHPVQDGRQLFVRADQFITDPDNIVGSVYFREVVSPILPVAGNPLIRFQDNPFVHAGEKNFHFARKQGRFDRLLILIILNVEMSA